MYFYLSYTLFFFTLHEVLITYYLFYSNTDIMTILRIIFYTII